MEQIVKIVLSKKEYERIRNIHFYKRSFFEKNGFPVDSKGKKIEFPSLEELYKIAVKQILSEGFREVNRVSPDDANCIIRVFNKCHYPYSRKSIHNLCGFMCFTKNSNNIWTSTCGNSQIELNFSKFIQRQYIFQDEYIDYNCDFFDSYVYVLK